MTGDTEAEQAIEKTEDVLSQTEVSDGSEVEVQTLPEELAPKEKTPEEREATRAAISRRLEHKAWKQKLASIKNDKTSLEAAEEAAKEEGFDPSKEENKLQIRVMAKTVQKTQDSKDSQRNGILSKAANGILTETLKDLGVDPGTPQGRAIGQSLFNQFGIDNPDLYENRELVEAEIEKFRTLGVKKVSGVQAAVLNKAAGVAPKAQSRTSGPGAAPDSATKEVMQRFQVSKDKAIKILELQKKKPSWA